MNTPQSESALQAQIVQWLQWTLPKDAFLTAFPAGGGGPVRGAKLKRMGLVAGVPDLMLAYQGRVFFIEIKTARGRVSAAQRSCADRLLSAGIYVHLARSVMEVEGILRAQRIPMRARVAA